MTFFEYDPKQIGLDQSEFLQHLDPANTEKVTRYAVLNLADGLSTLLGFEYDSFELISKLEALSRLRVEKVLKKQAKILGPFLEFDELPKSKSYQRWHWTSYRYRALLQVVVVYVRARFADKDALRKFLSWLKDGPFLQQFAALGVLEAIQFEHADPLGRPWLNALRAGIRNSTDIGSLFAEIAEVYELNTLVPDLMELAKRVSASESSCMYLSLIKLAKGARQRRDFAAQALPNLDREHLEKWFSNLARADEKSGELGDVIRQVIERLSKVATPLEFGDFLRQPRGAKYTKYATENDIEMLRQVAEIANPENDPNIDDRIAKAKSALRRLIPDRDIQLLLESGRFEDVCKKLSGDVHQAEIPAILKRAGKALKGSESFEGNAVRLLLNDCGEAGREFVVEHLDAFDLTSVQYLHWFAQQCSLDKLVEAAIAAGLSDRTAKSLILSIKRKNKTEPVGPKAFVAVMEACKRYSAYDLEDGAVPPDYKWLIKELCKRTAGSLKPTSIRIKETSGADGWTITFMCSGEAVEVKVSDQGDWYDAGVVEAALEKVAKKSGLAEQFVGVWLDSGQVATSVFGNPTSVRKVARLAGVPVRKWSPEELQAARLKLIATVRKEL